MGLVARVLQVLAEGDEHEGQGGDALLAVDQQPAGEAGRGVARGHVDHRAHKVRPFGGTLANGQYVVPQLGALQFGPAVVALKHGNHKLRGAVDDFGELAIDGFHGCSTRRGRVMRWLRVCCSFCWPLTGSPLSFIIDLRLAAECRRVELPHIHGPFVHPDVVFGEQFNEFHAVDERDGHGAGLHGRFDGAR